MKTAAKRKTKDKTAKIDFSNRDSNSGKTSSTTIFYSGANEAKREKKSFSARESNSETRSENVNLNRDNSC